MCLLIFHAVKIHINTNITYIRHSNRQLMAADFSEEDFKFFLSVEFYASQRDFPKKKDKNIEDLKK